MARCEAAGWRPGASVAAGRGAAAATTLCRPSNVRFPANPPGAPEAPQSSPPMDQKNLIVAIVLSVLIIMGWQYAFPPTKPPVNTTTQQQTTTPGTTGTPQAPSGQPVAPGAQPATAAAPPIVSRQE